MIDIQNHIRNQGALNLFDGRGRAGKIISGYEPMPVIDLSKGHSCHEYAGFHSDVCVRCGLTGLDMMKQRRLGFDPGICRTTDQR